MKVICTQENLKSGLAAVGRIISSNSSLPILNNILIKTENGLLKISSTNLEIAITTHIRCKVEEEGETTVLSKTITDLINNLPNKNVVLTAKGPQMDIEAENYHTSIKTLPAEEFPLIPSVENSETILIDSQKIKEAMDQVAFAASTNQTQPEISGILFSITGDEMKVVATDRYRLAEKKTKLLEKPHKSYEVIVPHKTIQELSRIIGSQKGVVNMVFSETQVSMFFNDTQIISRLVDGQYPPYQQIIPTEFITTVVADKQAFINALRAGGVFSQGSNSVNLSYDSQKQILTVTSESNELGKSVVEVPSQIKGDAGSLILNYHYIIDCLQSIETPQVKMEIIDDSSPSLIVPIGKNDYTYLVMPIKS